MTSPIPPVSAADSTGPLLLYDGTCGFCARSVQWVLEHEGPRRTLRFARLEGPIGRALIARRPELRAIDSVVWYEPAGAGRAERALTRSAAALEAARYIGGVWAMLAAPGRLVPRVVRDAAYDFVARHRHRIVGRELCVIPTAEQRVRFVDLDAPC